MNTAARRFQNHLLQDCRNYQCFNFMRQRWLSTSNGTLKITRIQAFQVDLPLHEGRYKWSDGKFVDVFDSTVVRIETNEGIVG